MRSGTLALFAVLLLGFAGLLVTGLTKGSGLVYTLGVAPQGPVAALQSGSRACQGPVDLPDGASFERIGFYPRATGGAGLPVEVTVRPAAGGSPLTRGRLEPASYGHSIPPALRHADVSQRRQGDAIEVCFQNRGSRAVELWGTGAIASPWTAATVDGKPADFDLGVTFDRRHERPLIALAPAMGKRASIFHPQLASPAVYALLAALLLVGGPALLVVALRRAG